MPIVERVTYMIIKNGCTMGTEDALRLQIGECTVLVSEFFGDLKAFPILKPNEYKFLGEATQVEITDLDLLEIEMAFEAHVQFQKWRPDFRKKISKISLIR